MQKRFTMMLAVTALLVGLTACQHGVSIGVADPKEGAWFITTQKGRSDKILYCHKPKGDADAKPVCVEAENE